MEKYDVGDVWLQPWEFSGTENSCDLLISRIEYMYCLLYLCLMYLCVKTFNDLTHFLKGYLLWGFLVLMLFLKFSCKSNQLRQIKGLIHSTYKRPSWFEIELKNKKSTTLFLSWTSFLSIFHKKNQLEIFSV